MHEKVKQQLVDACSCSLLPTHLCVGTAVPYGHQLDVKNQPQVPLSSAQVAGSVTITGIQSYGPACVNAHREACTWAAGKATYESDDIIKYLFNEYGDGRVPWGLSLGFFTVLSCGLALLPRSASLAELLLPLTFSSHALGPSMHCRLACGGLLQCH